MKKKLKLSDLHVDSFVTESVKGGDPTNTIIPTRCCTGMYPTLNMPCPTVDVNCNSVQPCIDPRIWSVNQCPTLPVDQCV